MQATTQATTTLSAAPLPAERRQRRAAAFQLLLRQRLAVPALAVLLLVVLSAIFANVIAPYDPERQDYAHVMEGPSRTHLLGTDDIGRDVLSRIIYGSRTSVSVGLVAVAISIVFGVTLGLVAAYVRGWVDDVIMRVMDALAAFPALVLALGITAALKPGLLNVMISIGVIFIPQFARLARGESLSVRELEYVTAARVLGAGAARTIWRHIWPNITAPIIVQASLRVAAAIVTEASLSFLGAGVPPPTASWGGMLRSSYQFTETAPWLALFPGAAIFLTVLASNLFGDALRSALDPRMRGRD
jgi:ABC-type dipeptide/oligopeptide/nickel transport system permease subunit